MEGCHLEHSCDEAFYVKECPQISKLKYIAKLLSSFITFVLLCFVSFFISIGTPIADLQALSHLDKLSQQDLHKNDTQKKI